MSNASTAPPTEDNIGRNSVLMFIGTFGSRILGFIRGALLTLVAGAALAADSFTLGNSVPTLVYVMINGGLLSAVLIPQLVKAMARSDGGQDFTDRLITLSLLVLGGVTLLCLVATPWIVNALSSNKDPQFLSLTVMFAYICMPQIFFYGLYSVLGQVLNAHGRFAAFAWAPAWANVINIIGLVWFLVAWGKQPDVHTWTTEMIWVLAGSTTLGIIAQGVGLLIPLRRTGFHYRPRFGWRGYGFGEVSRMALWTMAALAITQAVGLVTVRALTVGASQMENVAGNAVQQYAYSLFILPHSLITVSIVTALFPAMSRAVERADTAGLRDLVVTGLKAPAVLIIPATAALVALGQPMASTLYPGLRYDAAQGINERWDVALVLALMAIGILPLGLTAVKQRYAFARVDGWFNLWTVSVMAAGNLLTAYLAMFHTPPQYVVAVVALGASLSSTAAALCFIVVARRQLDGLDLPSVLSLWGRLTVAAAVPAAIAWWVSTRIADASSPWLQHAIALAVGGVILTLGFFALARLLRVDEVADVVRRVTGRFARRASG